MGIHSKALVRYPVCTSMSRLNRSSCRSKSLRWLNGFRGNETEAWISLYAPHTHLKYSQDRHFQQHDQRYRYPMPHELLPVFPSLRACFVGTHRTVSTRDICDSKKGKYHVPLANLFVIFAYFLFGFELSPSVHFPCTKKSDPRSAFSNIETFWRILWQSDRTSSSLHISFTYCSSKKQTLKSSSIPHALQSTRYILQSATCGALTNSKINCFSSKCLSSLRDSRCGRWWWLEVELIGLVVEPDAESLYG